MTITTEQAKWFAETFASLATNVEKSVLGKRSTVELALTCMLTEGHLLLDDVPGTGKTSLAKALANTVQGTQSRIQFTPDLLPSDVTGATVYNQRTGEFEFHKGPVFATVVLIDEINRASPKTQSALLEVMEEGHISVDGIRHDLGRPFLVIATQNPVEQAGVYPLPEAQLDRFLMRTSLGYPDHDTTVALLAEASQRDRSTNVEPLITATAVAQMADLAGDVHVDSAVLAYVTSIAEQTRQHPQVKLGVSTRGCLALVRATKAWAASRGRNHVIPDDVKVLAHPVLAHRVLLSPDAEFSGTSSTQILEQILTGVSAPSDRGGSGAAGGSAEPVVPAAVAAASAVKGNLASRPVGQ
ncbi:MAG: MoxR family ATPase [Actinobacteria bacterium]|nr:MoxR family ATPase [Actinomycetota bacterium]